MGEGPEKAKLQAQAAGLANVRFLPAVARAEMPALVAAADLALITLGEHLPGAVPSMLFTPLPGVLKVSE